MRKILVTIPVTEDDKLRLAEICPDAEFVFTSIQDATYDEAQSAEVILGSVPVDLLKNSPNLRFIQLNSAGSDGYTAPGALPDGTLLTNATGGYGAAISEHMLALLLAIIKNVDNYRDCQRDGKWCDLGPVPTILNSKTLVVGFGDIGGEFARKMAALGSSVTGIRRHRTEKPEYLAALGTMDELFSFAAEADFIAACLPGTADTYHVFNDEFFARVKPGAYFINVGRGTAVDQPALIRALESGALAGAALDVTDPEPLPADSPLWQAPNLLITPHISGGYHTEETRRRIFNIAAENLSRYLAGKPLKSIVDFSTGYRKFEG